MTGGSNFAKRVPWHRVALPLALPGKSQSWHPPQKCAIPSQWKISLLLMQEESSPLGLLQQCPNCPSAVGPLPKVHGSAYYHGVPQGQWLLWTLRRTGSIPCIRNLAFCRCNQELKTVFGDQNQGPCNTILFRKGSKNTRKWHGCSLPLLCLISPIYA